MPILREGKRQRSVRFNLHNDVRILRKQAREVSHGGLPARLAARNND
jgi:hypothetical protein